MNTRLASPRLVRWLAGMVIAATLAGCAAAPAAPTAQSATEASATPTAAPAPATATAVATTAPTAAPTATTAPTTAPAPASPTAAPVSPTAPAPTAAPSATAVVAQPATFSAEAAFRHVEALAVEIGSRAAGTEGERRAATYIDEQLAKLGYRVARQPFPITSFRDGGSTLTATGLQGSLNATALRYSGGGKVDAPIVLAGQGARGDFAQSAIKGKIALIERGAGLTFQEKAANAKAAGAAGVVIYNNVDGAFTGGLSGPFDLPTVSLSRADGLRLRQAVEQRGPVEASLRVDAVTEQTPSQNVIAVRPDLPANLPIVVVGGHFDSVPAGPGANDNASGTAVMLEMARVLAADRRAEFRFIAFGAEELGLLGSKYYVDQLPGAEKRRIVAMVNLDMLAVGDALLIGGSDDLTTRAIAVAKQLGVQSASRMGGGRFGGSDHASFGAAGIPTLFINRPDDPRYHTAQDQAPQVQPEALRVAGEISLRVIDQVLTK